MSILVNKNTRLLVQGITGREGLFHTRQMIALARNLVAGVTPGKGGEWVEGVPVFDTVRQGWIDRRQLRHFVCAGAFRARRDVRGRGCRYPADRDHH